jgi:[acyl-carrier-protein] S-malonyltransferase
VAIAWLFPGQGAQTVGMGKDVLAASAAAREVFERVDAALGERLSRLVLEGPESELTVTANAQPAIVATSSAILAAIRERAPGLAPPACAAGHSLGEYSALVAAEALTLADAVRLVRARGRAMQEAVPRGVGAMSAILGVDPGRVAALCAQASAELGEVVSPANFNAPGQVVVAGHAGAVARVGALVAAEKGRAMPLNVSAPFHCSLMAPAARVVEAELERVTVRAPKFPIVANLDARPNADPSRIKALLVGQVQGPVRWEESVRAMVEAGVTHALEIGPGKVLANLAKRIAKDLRVHSIHDLATLDRLPGFLETTKAA